jgi:hypothetical protein
VGKKRVEFVGGPLCGKAVSPTVLEQDWVQYAIKHMDGSVIQYSYIYVEETNNFEFAGFQEEGEELDDE